MTAQVRSGLAIVDGIFVIVAPRKRLTLGGGCVRDKADCSALGESAGRVRNSRFILITLSERHVSRGVV